jgi:hypothetical protein
MVFYLYIGSLFTAIGVVAALVPGRMCDFFAATAHAFFSQNRADGIVRSQDPRAQRIVGVVGVVFGVFIGAKAFSAPDIPPNDSRDIAIFVLAGVIATAGVVVLLGRHSIADFAARRIVRTGGERFCDPDVETSASRIVRIMGAWFLLLAGVPVAFVLTAQWG